MRKATVVLVSASIAAGLLLGLAIRRARLPEGPPLGAAPSAEGVSASLLRAEIRDLDARIAALREETDRVERERDRLEALAAPPPPPSPEMLLRQGLRKMLENRSYDFEGDVIKWIQKDPLHFRTMLQIAAEVFREKDWGRFGYDILRQAVHFYAQNARLPDNEQLPDFLLRAQQKEPDSLIRCWMLEVLELFKIEVPAEQLPELVDAFKGSKDPHFREAAFGLILKDGAANADLIRDAIRSSPTGDERTSHLLKAWDKRGLPVRELRGLARDIMTSDDPCSLIMDAQDWVPKYINPLQPQETIALFDQTMGKAIDPTYKAVSVMVMGSIATLFPGRPGRAEIERVATSADDARLKDFARKVGSLVDEGKSFAEIRKLNPLEHGFSLPR